MRKTTAGGAATCEIDGVYDVPSTRPRQALSGLLRSMMPRRPRPELRKYPGR